MNAYVGWLNAVISGALTSSSAVSGLPVSNMQGVQGASSDAWQTVGCTAEWATIDSGTSLSTWQAFGLFRTNLSASSATVRWRVSNSAAMTSPVYDSGVISAGVVATYQQSVLALSAPVTGRYARVDITDPSNPDGFLSIPLAFAGPVFCPLTNQDFSGGQGRMDGTTETTTRGGQEFPLTTWARRTADVSMQGIRTAEAWPSIQAIDAASSTQQNILWIPTPNGAYQGQETVFGRLKRNGSMTWPYQGADRRAYKFQITERL